MKKYCKIISMCLVVVVCFCAFAVPAKADLGALAVVGAVVGITSVLAAVCVAFGLGDDGGLMAVVNDMAEDARTDGYCNQQGYFTSYFDPVMGKYYVAHDFLLWAANWLNENNAFAAETVPTEINVTSQQCFGVDVTGYISPASFLSYAASMHSGIADVVQTGYGGINDSNVKWVAVRFGSGGWAGDVYLYWSACNYITMVPTDTFVQYCAANTINGLDGTWTQLKCLNSYPWHRSTGSVTNANTVGQTFIFNVGEGVAALPGVVVPGTAPDFNLTDPMDTYADWGGIAVDGVDAYDASKAYGACYPMVIPADPAAVFQLEQEAVQTLDDPIAIEQADPLSFEDADYYRVDLISVFPFCIPFDVYNLIEAFDASPVAPHFQIPFNIPAANLSYTFDLDFSQFSGVASVLRTMELILFCVGLALVTYKLIKW